MYQFPPLYLLRDSFASSSQLTDIADGSTLEVSMRSMIALTEFQDSKCVLPVAMGRTSFGEAFISDLTNMPHLLIVGDEAQDRAQGVNAIITSLLYESYPSQLKFLTIDNKKAEHSIYSLIPDPFLAKFIDEGDEEVSKADAVICTLNSLRLEMEARYDLLKKAQVRTIREYNDKFIMGKLDARKGHKFLPYIVAVIDDYTELIKVAGKDIGLLIASIAQLGHVVGLHLIIVTESASKIVLTDSIKQNFPTRMVFRLSSLYYSMTLLDSDEATKLKGNGEMIIDEVLCQTHLKCPLVSSGELRNICNYIGKQLLSTSPYYLPIYNKE